MKARWTRNVRDPRVPGLTLLAWSIPFMALMIAGATYRSAALFGLFQATLVFFIVSFFLAPWRDKRFPVRVAGLGLVSMSLVAVLVGIIAAALR